MALTIFSSVERRVRTFASANEHILGHATLSSKLWVFHLQLTEGSHSQQFSLLPFDGSKQNLLLRVLDALGLQNSAGVARINITAVHQSCTFRAGSGHQGRVSRA